MAGCRSFTTSWKSDRFAGLCGALVRASYRHSGAAKKEARTVPVLKIELKIHSGMAPETMNLEQEQGSEDAWKLQAMEEAVSVNLGG